MRNGSVTYDCVGRGELDSGAEMVDSVLAFMAQRYPSSRGALTGGCETVVVSCSRRRSAFLNAPPHELRNRDELKAAALQIRNDRR